VSEVHRYKVVTMLSEDGNKISYKPHGPEVVTARDYDAAQSELTALREELSKAKSACSKEFESVQTLDNENTVLKAELAALREELADISAYNDQLNTQCENMQQRLADAERRNSELECEIAAALPGG